MLQLSHGAKIGTAKEYFKKKTRWKYHSDVFLHFEIEYFEVTQLQKIISQKVIKISERDFQRIFFYKCSVSVPNLESLALL